MFRFCLVAMMCGLLGLCPPVSAQSGAAQSVAAQSVAAPTGAVAVTAVAAEGTQFRLSLSDGRVLRSPELAGAEDITEGICDIGGTALGADAPFRGKYRMLLLRPDITFWLLDNTSCMARCRISTASGTSVAMI